MLRKSDEKYQKSKYCGRICQYQVGFINDLLVKRKFDEAWLHDDKSASVKAIYYIDRPATERDGGIMKTMLRRFKRCRYDSSYINTTT